MGLIVKDPKRHWPGGEVVFKKGHPAPRLWTKFTAAVRWLNRSAPVNLRIDDNDLRAIGVYGTTRAASSHFGRAPEGDTQWISYSDNSSVGVVMHELLHVLGVLHEHQRADRDNHVKINLDNMRKNYHHQMNKSNGANAIAVGEYDLQSIMHPRTHLHSANGLPTIEPFGNVAIGQRDTLSEGDIQSLEVLYGEATTDPAVELTEPVEMDALEVELEPVTVHVPPWQKVSQRVTADNYAYFIEVTNFAQEPLRLDVNRVQE